MRGLIQDIWVMRWPLGLAAMFGAVIVGVVWLLWRFGWYFNGN